MSSTKTISPIRKAIFLQKIFRFAGRTVKDLVIINNVCKDFEETVQAHHTFNLVLYDNIIKKRRKEEEFLWRSVWFLAASPAWIVYQWTTVNEHDETQRELLKTFLLYQAEISNIILIRKNVNGEDPSTTHELFCHILDSCVKLGIAKEVLEARQNGLNCIMKAVSRKISAECLMLLIETCARYGLDMKEMLEEKNDDHQNCIMIAAQYQLPIDSFKLLMEFCAQHGLDVKMMLDHKDNDDRNCIMLVATHQPPVDSFKFLIGTCLQHGLDMKMMLEQIDSDGYN